MRARDVFLALLVIAAGVFLTYQKSGRLDHWFNGWDGPWFGSFDEFTYEETREISGPLPAEWQVINSHGEIGVTGSATDQATVIFKERIYARTKADADRIAADLRMTVTRSESRVILTVNREDFRRKNFSTDFKIVVPAGAAVLLKNSYGLVRAEGTGNTEISNPHGEVVARGIAGSLTVTSSYEKVDVDGVRGNIQISAPHADVDVKNVESGLGLDHSYGAIRLDHVAGKTIVNGNHSAITARNLGAEAKIFTTYETIKITDAGTVLIRARHCDVEAKAIGGLFDVSDDYGRIRVESLAGDLKIDGRNVEVDGLDLKSSDIFVRTSNQDVSLAGFSGKASVVLSHGRLFLKPGSAPSGTIDVDGTYADVQLDWPEAYRAPFEARTQEGRIIWNLPERPDSETSNGQTETKAFSAEAGKPGIKISTTHGDVQVDPAARGTVTSALNR